MASDSTVGSLKALYSTTPLGRLLEALMAYAIDPTQWDTLATEFDRQSDNIAKMDPSEFLTHLSHAESLAWQLKGEPVSPAQYAYVLLNQQQAVISVSRNFADLTQYVRVTDDRNLEFTASASLAELNDGQHRLSTSKQTQALVTLRREGSPSRFGYLMPKDRLPAALRMAHPEAHSALFIAQDTATEHLFRVLQTSFALTDAETSISLKLASGLPLKEAAQSLGISVNTARNQLQAVFDKSGVKRQSDLILVVTQMSVILAATVATEPSLRTVEVTDHDYPSYRFCIAPQGNRLAYREYGDGEQAVLFFHESVGSSRLLPGTHEWANRNDLRIIAPDRPGFGFSDGKQHLTLEGVAEDMLSLLDTLGIGRATYVGLLAGAAYALATASLEPQRADQVWCISGRLPSAQDDATLAPLVKVRAQLARQPWVLNSFFNILRSRSSDALHRRLAKRIYGATSADAELLESQPLVLEHIIGSTQESMAQSTAGIVEEIRLFTTESGIVLDTLTMPVTLWHGRADPIAHPETLKTALSGLQHEYREFADSGSLLVFAQWQQLLAAVSAARRRDLP